MNNNIIIKRILASVFITGLIILLKLKFNTPNLAIVFIIMIGFMAGLIRTVVFGFFNPPDWLYRIRFSIFGIFYGIFIGIMFFGKESIEENTFVFHELLKSIILGSVIGVIINLFYNESRKLNSRKGFFLSERQLVKDFAQLIKQDGKSISGKLVLTNDNLIFLGALIKHQPG